MEKEQKSEITIWNKNFICVMIANFMLVMAHSSINPLVERYTEHLGANPQLVGLLVGMFFGVALAMRPFAGPVTTKVDKRKLLVIVFILGAVANLGYALFHNIPAFVAFRVIHGIQFSLIGLVLLTLASDHLPPEKMASGMGIYGIGGAIGAAVAPSIGAGWVALGTNLRSEGFGFTLMFLFGTAMFLLAIIPSLILAPDRKTKAEIKSTGAWYKNILSIHAVPTATVIFLLVIANSLIHTYMFGFGIEQGIYGISIFYLVLALTLAVSRPMCGVLTDRLGVSKVMFPGLALFAVALVVIGFSTALWMTLVGAVMVAIGLGGTQPTIQAMCMQSETPLRRGVAGNTFYIGLDLGLFLGPVLGGFVRTQTSFAFMFRSAAVPVVFAIAAFAIILPIHNRRLEFLGTKG
ncbi:MAG: MFS transporter [Oscillospiraceae bacterium]|nr:MFS transporter [Oscillospiraceae bacterium]